MAISTLNDNAKPGLGHLLRVIDKPSEIGSLKPRFPKESEALVSISSVGGQTGRVSTRLGELSDTDVRRRAQDGLRAVVGTLGYQPAILL